MSIDLSFGFLLGAVWGEAVAIFIRHTKVGRALAAHLMWFVVSVGCGVSLLFSLMWLEDSGMILWWKIPAILGVSAVPIAIHSIVEGFVPMLIGIMNGVQDTDTK